MPDSISLSQAKARLSEVVRIARKQGRETVITVDGEPAARVVPIGEESRPLADAEVAQLRALMASLERIPRAPGEFDAVELVQDGRR